MKPTPRKDGLKVLMGPRVTMPDIRAVSAQEFEAANVFVGSFVITRCAASCPLAKQCPTIAQLPFWVFVVHAHVPPGGEIRERKAHVTVADEDVYEAQLYTPEDGGTDMRQPLSACWEANVKAFWMKTQAEKDSGAAAEPPRKRIRLGNLRPRTKEPSLGPKDVASVKARKPITTHLRPGNLIGGGFALTRAMRVPAYIVRYLHDTCNIAV